MNVPVSRVLALLWLVAVMPSETVAVYGESQPTAPDRSTNWRSFDHRIQELLDRQRDEVSRLIDQGIDRAVEKGTQRSNDQWRQAVTEGTNQRLHALETRMDGWVAEYDDKIDSAHDRGFRYVQWQATLFGILMAAALFAATVAYVIGFHVGYRRLQASIDARVTPLEERWERRLGEFVHRCCVISDAAYKSAMTCVKSCYACGSLVETAGAEPEARRVLGLAMAMGYRLQVLLGDKEDVITGALSLSGLVQDHEQATQSIAAMREALSRDDLDEEAKEKLRQAIDQLEKRMRKEAAEEHNPGPGAGDSTA